MKTKRNLLLLAALAWAMLAALPVKAQVAGAIAVYPQNSSLEAGSTLKFTSYVPISPNTINWLVNGVVGGNSTVGTISTNGLYQPPAVIPVSNVVTVAAQSTAFPGSIGSTSLKITRKYPWLWSVSPAQLQTGNYQVSFNGASFAPDSVAMANGVDIATAYKSPTSITASGFGAVGTIAFAVRQPGNGAVTGNVVSVQVVASIVTVTVVPGAANIQLGASQQFTATVVGNANTAVTWTVNGLAGGSAAVGTISATGLYTAPVAMPSPNTVTIKATSVANPASSAQVTATLMVPPPPPVTVTVAPSSVSVQLGASQPFTATVQNTNNTAVSWSVNGIVGGSGSVGVITAGGVYTAPAVPPAGGAVTVKATSVASPVASGQAAVTLTVPPPPPVWLPGARFLEQSSFGPSPTTLAKVQQMGIGAYLQDQFNTPETVIPSPADNSMGALQQWVLYNYTTAPDQLRQRVAYSLSQIIVTSSAKLIYADEMLPWLRLLSKEAFGNYRSLLREISTCPSMGKYLDLANSMKPGLAGGANENYARELMQLFTIGLWQLNQDGSQVIDPNTQQPIPTYDQSTVAQVALALTGWTYATAPGATPQSANWEYFGAPMETRAQNHDTSAKSFLGCSVPAGQSVDQDLDSLIDCLMNHPNIAPFISTRLIRSLVTSNPSPGYINRVANIFVDNGSGVRGDLQAVVTAILLDPEARQDVNPAVDSGRLKEPILHISGLLRALNGGYTPNEGLTYMYDYMAQTPLGPASVFSWFSPLYHIPKLPLFGPEFQVYTPSEATMRGNFFFQVLHYPATDVVVDLSPFQPYCNDMAGLVEAANQVFLYGRMDPAMKQVLINAASPGYDAATRIETVLYLTSLSGQYAIQY